ncbi:MAG: TonB-dependent receptor, partial [Desulfuromonadales bacterium]|nr:TonB-dependent receptor [Desulfuromonadales bacterium]NIS39531.1 TonB-dependent receptor [Desulfuromonadales bacterium]
IGNPNLKPEESFSWEVGFEQELFEGRLNFGSTYFESDIEDGVVTTFSATGSTSVNNADIETYGVESFIEVVPYEPLTVRVDYTFLRADNENTGQQLLRRPKHKVSADATWRFGERASLGLGMVFVG